ncbi:LysR substrate-binding domain-containing protein [Saccharopolyspora shandongensis]|uniref:LysR substrate-binding domain-containing protein n=1 Tax=Saccharopolyspora shandongensis TaxID=418495 RepID=UPI00341E6C40
MALGADGGGVLRLNCCADARGDRSASPHSCDQDSPLWPVSARRRGRDQAAPVPPGSAVSGLSSSTSAALARRRTQRPAPGRPAGSAVSATCPDSTYYQLVITACMAAGFSPNVAHYADEWDTGTALVAHRFGIILVPRLARLHSYWPVARIPLHGEPAPARRILAATRMGGRDNPTIARALQAITKTAAAILPGQPG